MAPSRVPLCVPPWPWCPNHRAQPLLGSEATRLYPEMAASQLVLAVGLWGSASPSSFGPAGRGARRPGPEHEAGALEWSRPGRRTGPALRRGRGGRSHCLSRVGLMGKLKLGH